MLKDLTGMRFHRLRVISRAKTHAKNALWHCVCDCGVNTQSFGFALRNGEAKSCGCYSTDILRKNAFKHGLTKGPEWTSWSDMKSRCLNKKNIRYASYGGRGIKICKRWVHSFESFLKDMGPKPSREYTLERVNNDGNYEPKNCRWATRQEQNRNTQRNLWVVYRGKRMAMVEAIEAAGNVVGWHLAFRRVERGWPLDKAVELPPSSVPRGTYSRNP